MNENTLVVQSVNNNFDLMAKLHLNNGQLKYKEYCKALLDDFNSSYYKSNFKPP